MKIETVKLVFEGSICYRGQWTTTSFGDSVIPDLGMNEGVLVPGDENTADAAQCVAGSSVDAPVKASGAAGLTGGFLRNGSVKPRFSPFEVLPSSVDGIPGPVGPEWGDRLPKLDVDVNTRLTSHGAYYPVADDQSAYYFSLRKSLFLSPVVKEPSLPTKGVETT